MEVDRKSYFQKTNSQCLFRRGALTVNQLSRKQNTLNNPARRPESNLKPLVDGRTAAFTWPASITLNLITHRVWGSANIASKYTNKHTLVHIRLFWSAKVSQSAIGVRLPPLTGEPLQPKAAGHGLFRNRALRDWFLFAPSTKINVRFGEPSMFTRGWCWSESLPSRVLTDRLHHAAHNQLPGVVRFHDCCRWVDFGRYRIGKLIHFRSTIAAGFRVRMTDRMEECIS